VIEDRPPDAKLCVRRERRLLRRVVLLDGVEEADDPPGQQIVEFDVRGLSRREPLHDLTDEGQMAREDVVGPLRGGRRSRPRLPPDRACAG
jgi:hypothetical protein